MNEELKKKKTLNEEIQMLQEGSYKRGQEEKCGDLLRMHKLGTHKDRLPTSREQEEIQEKSYESHPR